MTGSLPPPSVAGWIPTHAPFAAWGSDPNPLRLQESTPPRLLALAAGIPGSVAGAECVAASVGAGRKGVLTLAHTTPAPRQSRSPTAQAGKPSPSPRPAPVPPPGSPVPAAPRSAPKPTPPVAPARRQSQSPATADSDAVTTLVGGGAEAVTFNWPTTATGSETVPINSFTTATGSAAVYRQSCPGVEVAVRDVVRSASTLVPWTPPSLASFSGWSSMTASSSTSINS